MPNISKYWVVRREGTSLVFFHRRRIGHAEAFDRLLRYAIDGLRRYNAGSFEDGWHDVDHMGNWLRMPPLSVMCPGHDIAIPGACLQNARRFALST